MIGIRAVTTFRPEKRTDISELAEQIGLSEEQTETLRDVRGLSCVMDSEGRTTYDMLQMVMSRLLEKVDVDPESVACLLYSHAMQSHPGGMMSLESLKSSFGMEGVPSLSISGMNCATAILAFDLAVSRLRASSKKYAILLFAEKIYTPLMRKIDDMTVLSDGAAACLIEKGSERNQIMSISQLVDGKLASIGNWSEEDYRWFQLSYFMGVKKLCKHL